MRLFLIYPCSATEVVFVFGRRHDEAIRGEESHIKCKPGIRRAVVKIIADT
jgi:hypothetical protein